MISTTTLNAAIENAARHTAFNAFVDDVEKSQHNLPATKTITSVFEVSKTYMTRSVGDHNCIIKVTIASRTKCFITTTEGERFKVSNDSSSNSNTTTHFEIIRPWGRYSMSPRIKSTDTKELKTDWEV